MLIFNYRRILTHPHARLCYLGVFVEGTCIMGLYPYVAAFLQQLGEPRLSIAGLVIAGYAIGGLSVGEPPEVMYEVVSQTVPFLPPGSPR